MNFDLGEVLCHAWQIASKQGMLWLIGILLGFLVSIMLPVLFSPVLFPVFLQKSKIDLRFGLLLTVVYTLAFYPIRVLVETSVPSGILNPTEAGDSISALYPRFTLSSKTQPLPGTVEATL